MTLTGLVLGALLGYALQRGRFCVTGAFRDLWVARNSRWFSAFLLVIAIQSVGLFAMNALGIVNLTAPATFPWLATVVGAVVFGVGIVYAGGCATGTFYRSGEGLVGSWFGLVFYALSAAAMKYGFLKPLDATLRGPTTKVTTIDGALGVSPWILVALLVAGVGLLVRHHLTKPKVAVAALPARRRGLAHLLAEKPWGAYATAIVIGVIAIAAWPLSWATGRKAGLGITTPSADLATYVTTGKAASLNWGTWLVLGLLVGSFAAAKASGEFRIRVPDGRTVVRAIGGGTLMGVGAAWAGGCTIGNAMVNTAQFTLQGWVSLVCMVLGVGLATRLSFRTHRRLRTAPAGAVAGATA